MQPKKIPMRLCIACREPHPKKEMLRVVKNKEGEISLDFTGKKAGRGAYVCGKADCIKKLSKNKILNKVFECEVSPEIYTKILEEFLGNEK